MDRVLFSMFHTYFTGFIVISINWQERAALGRSAFGRSTAGNDVVATILISLSFSPFSPFSAVTFSHRGSAWIKKLIL